MNIDQNKYFKEVEVPNGSSTETTSGVLDSSSLLTSSDIPINSDVKEKKIIINVLDNNNIDLQTSNIGPFELIGIGTAIVFNQLSNFTNISENIAALQNTINGLKVNKKEDVKVALMDVLSELGKKS